MEVKHELEGYEAKVKENHQKTRHWKKEVSEIITFFQKKLYFTKRNRKKCVMVFNVRRMENLGNIDVWREMLTFFVHKHT